LYDTFLVEPTQKYVADLKRWYESHGMAQKDLAAAVGMSPQGLADLFSNRNQPTGAQAVAILEFLQSQNMSVITNRPVPKTLLEAKEQLEALNQQRQALEARLAEHKRLGHVPKTAMQVDALPTPTSPPLSDAKPIKTGQLDPWPDPPVKFTMPASLVTPTSVQGFLDRCTVEQVLDIAATEKDRSSTGRMRSTLAWAELRKRRALETGNSQ
jgi:transcriptional regulator with XRE-family HTH domain